MRALSFRSPIHCCGTGPPRGVSRTRWPGRGKETRVLPSSGPRDQDAARCPPPGTSPGPVGEEGCVRLSSGRTRLPGRVPAPPRVSPVESNGRGVPLRREGAGRSRPRTLTTPCLSLFAPEEDRGFLTRTGSVVCSCRFCTSAAAEHWQLRTVRANTTRRVNPSGPREVTLCAALCLQKGRRCVSAVFRHVL